jgi:hypothetical protein
MRWLAGLVLAALPVAAWAEDARLSELRGMLVPLAAKLTLIDFAPTESNT